jgi:N-formylglutamate deformylase
VIPFFERRPTATPVPLLVSIPHTGTEIPVDMSLRLAPGVSPVADTDWHLHDLYDFAPELGAHTIYARFGRAVADLNRPAEGGALYPGRDETTVVPTSTFAGERLYAAGKEPTATEIEERLQTVWRPYHVRVRELLEDMRARFGKAVLFDAHSIKSEVPRFFAGRLDCLILGTNDGRACGAWVRDALEQSLRNSPFRVQVDTPFKGGIITRSFGVPATDIHAIQLEMGQSLYMDEERPEVWDVARAAQLRGALRSALESLVRAL